MLLAQRRNFYHWTFEVFVAVQLKIPFFWADVASMRSRMQTYRNNVVSYSSGGNVLSSSFGRPIEILVYILLSY